MKENLLITFLLVCVLKGAFVFALQCPSPGISMSLEDDNNFFVKYANVDTFDLCGTFCARSEECKYWTWFSEDYSDFRKYNDLDCLLFKNAEQLTQIDGTTSGEKMCPDTIEEEPECKNCSPEPIRFSIKDLNEISFDDGDNANFLDKIEGVGDSSLCGKLCAITTPCIYWTWYSSKSGKREANTCLMFDNIVQLRHNENAISGEKHNPDPNPEDSCPLTCPDPCVINPEPGPNNAGNALQFTDKSMMEVLGMAFYVAVMAAIKM